ncbi:MAG: right-handed parallel beta-helix repeat-containing protein [Candidatus Bathyarchaeota archaeon]|nr:right-handed parallel beta-helix repeat-containing protein [Candidatus Bathyarchaeota archaeon]
MSKIKVLLLVLVLIFSSAVVLPVDAGSRTIVVPDDYLTISSAIENASAGDTIFVRKGTYQEQSLEINKSISLFAEDSRQTILNLNPPLVKTEYLRNWLWIPASAININANDVTLQGFMINLPDDRYGIGSGVYIIGDRIALIDNTIANRSVYLRGNMQNITGNLLPSALEVIGSHQIIANNAIGGNLKIQGSFNQIFANNITNSYYFSGIHLNGSNNVIIKNFFSEITMEDSNSNIIGDNVFARLVLENFGRGCSHNIITKNSVAGNGGINDGIQVLSGSNNTVSVNNIRDCEYGLRVGSEATQNFVYLNNFFNNSEQHIFCYSNYTENQFDNGIKGNYYDSYHGNDGNWDGIGDSPYTIQEIHWDEELQREVTVVYFQDNLPLMAPFDIDGVSIQLPDWATASLNSLPETQTSEASPLSLVTITSASAVFSAAGLLVYFKKYKKRAVP